MKRFILIFAIIFTFFITNINVNAEENITTFAINKDTFNANCETYISYKSLIDEALTNYADSNDYYVITINEAGDLNDINLTIWDENATVSYHKTTYSIDFRVTNYKYLIHFYNNKIQAVVDNSNHENTSWSNLSSLLPDNLVDTNYSFYQNFYPVLEITGIFNDNITLNNGASMPTLKKLFNYNSWLDYTNDVNYTIVNLDDYEYVILSLKNYSQKEAFDTNLKVKGMIGITPVYEFGTAEKNDITDRCNISYSDYTDYRLYILKNDLTNNAVYYVKACEEGSSFKYDNTIFDITYVTEENVDNPVITINGTDYNVIPFDELSNSANENENNNYIPGQTSGSFSDFILNTFDYIESFWRSLITFMGLVTKFFNTLPVEIRAISITAFTTAITLGVIKIIKT